MRKKVILDCDPGHDDAIAILLACASPALEVKAITVVAGNQILPKTLRNALRVLTAAGIRDIPVAAGMARPLLRQQVIAPEVHGESGLDGPVLPEPEIEPHPLHAVDLIIEILRESPEKIYLVPTGPLTNIAMVLLRAPSVKHKIERIVLMGGAVTEGNITPSAEFNIYADAEAARIVFSSGLPITMVGLDVTHKAIITREEARQIRSLGTPVAIMVADMLDYFGRFHDRIYKMGGAPLHDPCAVAEVISPGIIATKKMYVDVETKGELTYGRTVCDIRGVTGKQPNVDVGLDIDREAFMQLLMEAIKSYVPR